MTARAITVSDGRGRAAGRALLLPEASTTAEALYKALRDMPSETGGWWAHGAFRAGVVVHQENGTEVRTPRPDHYRHGQLWHSSIALVGDCDRVGHHAWTEETRTVIRRAISSWDIPGSVFEVTPHGLRSIFPLSAPTEDAALWERAARGMCALLDTALAKIPEAGLEIDTGASCDRARYFWAPRATVPRKPDSDCSCPYCLGNPRAGELYLMRAQDWTLEELAAHAPAEQIELKRPGPIAAVIPAGHRHATFLSLAAADGARGLPREVILQRLKPINEMCDSPKPESELRGIVDWVAAKEAKAEGPKSAPAPERWTALDFELIERNGIPPLDWIFPGWVVAGDIFLFAGDAGVGKSTLLSRMAYAAATAGEWVGVQATRKMRVLYVDEEQSRGEVYGLFTKHGPRLPNVDLRVFVQQGANLDSDDGLAVLEREIADFKPDLVLIDSATAAFGKTDGNSNADVAAIFRRLRSLREKYNLTIGFNHHLGKPGEMKRSLLHRVLGSVAYGTQASAVFGAISKDADSIEFVQAKRRLAPKPYASMIVGYREEAGRCYLENRGAVEDKSGAVAACSEWILVFLGGLDGPAKTAAIVEAAKRENPAWTDDVVSKSLKHALKLEIIQKPQRGWYTIQKEGRGDA